MNKNTAQPIHTSRASSQAMQGALQKLVQALFREGLLPATMLYHVGQISYVTLSPTVACGFNQLQFGPSGSCVFEGGVIWQVHGQFAETIQSPITLLQFLSPYLRVQISPDNLLRLSAEIENHLNNDTLCIAYRSDWGRELAAQIKVDGYQFFLTWLRAAQSIRNKTLLLEQWGTIGHPWHPNCKTKLGLQPDDVIAMSPEFRASISIAITALRADAAVIAGVGSIAEYQTWFAMQYPAVWEAWCSALLTAGEQLQHWVPLPMHPYQLKYTIPQCFAAELQQGILRVLPDVAIQASPTMSFRSVVPEDSVNMPHMKLPVALRLTSAQRTVSPKSVVMGTRFTRLFKTIRDQGDFDSRLLFLQEQVGLYYQDAAHNDDKGRHLAVLYRQNPLKSVPDHLMLVPVGCLFAETPLTGKPLLTELVELYAQHHEPTNMKAAALAFFQAYATVVVGATLHAYLTLGIAFEAHQQNSLIVLDEQFLPVQVLIRDFGDVRIYAQQLNAAGYSLATYRAGQSVLTEVEQVRDKFLHAIMLCHVGEVAVVLSRCYGIKEVVFWRALRQLVEETFVRCQSKLSVAHWQREYEAILKQPWPAKALFSMRISDSQDDMLHQMSNPLQ